MPFRANAIEPLLDRAIAHHQSGELDEARSLYRAILRDEPRHFDALHLMGVLEAQRGRYDKAMRSIQNALKVNPRSDEAHFNQGNVFVRLQQSIEALASFDKALGINPGHPGALLNRANVLLELGHLHEALAAFDRILAVIPADPTVLNNRGALLERLGRDAEALDCYDQAIAGAPRHADAYYRRGMLLERLARYEDAIATYAKLIEIDPGYNFALGRLVHAKMHACDWLGLAEHIAALKSQVQASKCAADPFAYLAVSAEPREHLLCAQMFAANRYPALPPIRRSPNRKREKIRIAYVSGEFRDQATSYLTAELFERHDRDRFEVVGVSTGWNDHGPMRRRLEQAFDIFVDGSTMTDAELAKLMARSDIDIAVNLNGYFGNERTGVFALRPCPIQVNYLGFPGTMGVDYVDYILADRIVIPEDQRPFYSEKIVYLPDTYQVNDAKKAIGAHTPLRSEAGLPESGFVFCCFNNNHKITPEMFTIWTSILRQVEGSVLWLFQGNAAATTNLRAEAERRGIEGERIVFAPHVSLQDHLARHRLAGLFLDTLPHNAHTTCSDALWAGLPVLTCLGSSFAGRVAASLLNAIGLPELVAHSLEHYEARALELARNPALLAEIRDKLARNRRCYPLFDIARFCGHIEAAFSTMWERYRRNEPPASFSVEPSAISPAMAMAIAAPRP